MLWDRPYLKRSGEGRVASCNDYKPSHHHSSCRSKWTSDAVRAFSGRNGYTQEVLIYACKSPHHGGRPCEKKCPAWWSPAASVQTSFASREKLSIYLWTPRIDLCAEALSIGQYPNPLRWIRARYPTLSTATPESNEAAKQVGEFIHKLARKPESSCFEDKYRIWRHFHYLPHFRLCVCLYSFEKRTSLCKIRVYPSLLRKQQSLRIFEWRKF